MRLYEIIETLENLAPPSLQEGYDNSGLLTSHSTGEIQKALLTLDVTEEVVDEAHREGCQMIIAHHPIIFSGLKSLSGKTHVERTVISAIKKDIAIYAIHTNLDNVKIGVNSEICLRLGIEKPTILRTKLNLLRKLTVYVPSESAESLREALYSVGAGEVGNYSDCSFSTTGEGTFRPNEAANPTIGVTNTREIVRETKVEVIFESWKTSKIKEAMFMAHPYEEVAYQMVETVNELQTVGSGLVGNLAKPIPPFEFLETLKTTFGAGSIRYTKPASDLISRVAVCGGSGSFLLSDAIKAGAEAFVSADFTYHKFFDAENRIMIADIGHFESEQFTPSLLRAYLHQKLPTFATRLSETNTNPVKYF
jgi:dinuclear metal center YbgI/SA1388 family protein